MSLTTASIGWLVFVIPVIAAALTSFDDWAYQRVQLANVSIVCRYAGNGPPLLLVHGFPEHSVSSESTAPFVEGQILTPDSLLGNLLVQCWHKIILS